MFEKDASEEDFEREQAERREYVKNIGIEYRFGCYEEKRPEMCQLLGEYMEAIDQNFKAAYNIFKTNCEEKGFPRSCFKYAMYLLAGRECEPSRKKMIEPLEKSCEANMPKGCRFLSLVHWNGEKDRKPNSELAEKYMKKACDLEDAEACWLLSTWYIGRDAEFVTLGATKSKHSSHLGELPRNIDLAIKYGIRACDFGCFQSCGNVSRLYSLGDGIERDPVKAKLYLNKTKEAYKRAVSGDKVDFTG
ncbi:Sel1 repeat family protein [Acanthocheilonema viteae]|uniref:Uncharacterized protein n=1 Tax=Acanthocheilonema viteae TaxID=6277 RepID=A0A498S4G1_ACAVI|nr:unnamed protein product [Acanthocheilonema viteae]